MASSDESSPPRSELLGVARVRKPHGVRGDLSIDVSADAEATLRELPTVWLQQQGLPLRELQVLEVRGMRPKVIVRLDGIDMDEAQKLRGARLLMSREALPPAQEDEDEFFVADLEGCSIANVEGELIGSVAGVTTGSANDVLDVRLKDGARHLVPFVRDAVPQVDMRARVLTVDARYLGWQEEAAE